MKYTLKNVQKKKGNQHRKTKKQILVFKGGAWYSFFLPLLGYSDKDKDNAAKGDVNAAKGEDAKGNAAKGDAAKTDAAKSDEIQNAEKVEKPETGNKKKDKKKGKVPKNPRELYKVDPDDERIDKQFFDNPNITTWCFDEPNYKPVGIVHVTSVVGVNVLRSFATTLKNKVGLKGSIDENMHQLRNEIYLEMEKVMEKKNIGKICNVGVAFTKDSGSLILSAFGTALRKKEEQ